MSTLSDTPLFEDTDHDLLYVRVAGGQIVFPDEDAVRRIVERLASHRDHCEWCLAPTRRTANLRGIGISNGLTFDEHSNLCKEIPPDRIDEAGLEHAERDEMVICDCGRIDIEPQDSRPREIHENALEHVVHLLVANGADIDYYAAQRSVETAFEERRTGQFERTITAAIFHGHIMTQSNE